MTVSQYDPVVPYTDLGGRGYFGVNTAFVISYNIHAFFLCSKINAWDTEAGIFQKN